MQHKIETWRSGWFKWSSQSVPRQIIGAIVTVGALTTLVKMAIGAKELAVAWTFGIGDTLDIYVTALVIPTIFMSVLSGSLYSAATPIFTKIRETQGKQAQLHLFGEVTFWHLIITLICAVIAGFVGYLMVPMLGLGFSPEKVHATRQILPPLLIWLILASHNVLNGSLLNANEKFAWAAGIPIITPIATLVIVAIHRINADINTLLLGLLFGTALETFGLGILIFKEGLRAYHVRIHPSQQVKHLATQGATLIVSALIMSGTTLVDQIVVASLPTGSVASLKVANQFTGLFLSIVAIAVGTSAMPFMSKLIARADWQYASRVNIRFTVLFFLLLTPLALVLFWISPLLTQVVLYRGAITEQAASTIGSIMSLAVLQIPFYVAGIWSIRVISALGRNGLLIIAASIVVILNAVFDLLLVKVMGISGIAVASVIVAAINWLVLFGMSSKLLAAKTA